MLTVCSCSGYLKSDDTAGAAKNGTETEDKDGVDDQKEILDGVTPGQIAAIDSVREDIKNGKGNATVAEGFDG
jgi:hypothetical protein